MSTIARHQGSHRRLVRHNNGGATVEVRTPHTLKNDQTGAKITALTTNGAELEGAVSIDLDNAKASLVGTLASGCKVTISGTEYTTTAAVVAASNDLDDVPITPALAGDVADDTAVTITQDYGSATYPARRGQFIQRDVDGENIRLDDWFLRVATTAAIPEKATVIWDSDEVEVVQVLPFKPGASQASTRIHCRG